MDGGTPQSPVVADPARHPADSSAGREPAQGERPILVVTPTYAPDLDLFVDLHASVLRWFPDGTRHLAIVNETDLPRFRRFEGPRCEVVGVRDVLPRSVVSLPLANLWLNVRRPVPPLRGWIVQQLLKLAVAEQASEEVIVLADSDLVFVRPVTATTFAPGGKVRLYRLDDGVDESLPRHVQWHRLARDLLGLPPAGTPRPDYVSSLNSWDRDVARSALRRVEETTGKRWLDVIGRQLHFSEWTLYGVFADDVQGARNVTLSDRSLCHSYWDPVPLTTEAAVTELASIDPDDVAYMFSAKSRTPPSVRRAAHASVFGG
jgi:hypothetical protein